MLTAIWNVVAACVTLIIVKLFFRSFFMLTACAPAKLIISGEHAVLYGCPAIAMAINKYAYTTISKNETNNTEILLNLINFNFQHRHTLHNLASIKQKLSKNYHDFLNGNRNIKEVLNMPFELLQFTLSTVVEKLNLSLPTGINIQTKSDIPIGCGLGSSAATIVSLISAIDNWFNLKLSSKKIITIAKIAENLQHAKSSGLDLHLSLNGGSLLLHNNKFEQRNFVQRNFSLVNSGKPQASTGECVNQTKKFLQKDKLLLQEFSNVTLEIDKILQNNTCSQLIDLIRLNHKLLCRIGVVPLAVQKFINHIEENGGAAKICGAGSIQGNNAGTVLVISKEDINDLCKKFNYEHYLVNGDNNGIKIVQS